MLEFYHLVLIFIICMIALALLIYYCQEYRNPKYSFTGNQRDISAIALAIGVPGFLPSDFSSAHHSPGFKPTFISPPPAPGFAVDGIPSAPYPTTDLPHPPPPPPPLPREYVHALMIPEDMSDSGSSSSDQIYFAPKTAAYSVAKRMSISANAEALARRMSSAAYPKGRRPSISADVAAYLIAKRMSETPYSRGTNTSIRRKANDSADVTQNKINPTNAQLSENATVQSSNSRINSLRRQRLETLQHKRTSPHPSESASGRSSTSRTDNPEDSCNTETNKRRSTSPYIPASVVGFHLKNKSARSGSPYSPLRSDSPLQEQNGRRFNSQKSQSPSALKQIPSPPKRSKRPSLKPAETHPLKYTENAPSMYNEHSPPQRSENICFPKRSESLPSKHSEHLPTKRSESLPAKGKTYSTDRLPVAASEVSYRSHSPTPLHTVEEED